MQLMYRQSQGNGRVARQVALQMVSDGVMDNPRSLLQQLSPSGPPLRTWLRAFENGRADMRAEMEARQHQNITTSDNTEDILALSADRLSIEPSAAAFLAPFVTRHLPPVQPPTWTVNQLSSSFGTHTSSSTHQVGTTSLFPAAPTFGSAAPRSTQFFSSTPLISLLSSHTAPRVTFALPSAASTSSFAPAAAASLHSAAGADTVVPSVTTEQQCHTRTPWSNPALEEHWQRLER